MGWFAMAVTGLGLIAVTGCGSGGNDPSAPATPSATFDLLIEWPTVPDATSYVVYRDFQCGSSPLTGVLVTVLSRQTPMMNYEDKSVSSNQPKVCYEVSSVNSGGESAHSARVTAILR